MQLQKKVHPIIVGFVIVVSMFVFATVGLMFVGSRSAKMMLPGVNLSEEFMGYLKNENFSDAFLLLSTYAQLEVGSVEQFEDSFVSNNMIPFTWDLSVQSIEDGKLHMVGRAVYKSGKASDIQITVLKTPGGNWYVMEYDFARPDGE